MRFQRFKSFAINSFLALFLLFQCGCYREPCPDDCCVRGIIDERIQKDVYWTKYNCHPLQEVICCLTQSELTLESAIQIALLNNPKVQIIFDEIGIAHADLIEAGLFRNPIFDGYVRFPDRTALSLNTQFSIAQSFLDIFLIPLKKRVARAELEQTKLKVANAILNLAFEVKEAFYSYVAHQKKLSLLELLVETTDIAKTLAILQEKAGNINPLELQERMNDAVLAKIDYSENKIKLIFWREELTKLLGFPSTMCLSLPMFLPEMPCAEFPCDCLETLALSKRLDIEGSRWEAESLLRLWKTKQWWSAYDGTLGVSTEHEAEGFQETGPAFSIPLPFFNYGQADRARIHALYDQSLNRLKELEISILSEVRAATDKILVYREIIDDYQKNLLPLQKSILSTSQSYYNYMALGVYKLLGFKKQEITTQIKYNEILLDYWKAQVNLDRALGGNLPWALSKSSSVCMGEMGPK